MPILLQIGHVEAELHHIPEEFVVALQAEPRALRRFQRESQSYRNGLLALLDKPCEEDRREQRIALVIKTLLQYGAP